MAWLCISDNDKTYFTRDRVSQRPSIFWLQRTLRDSYFNVSALKRNLFLRCSQHMEQTFWAQSGFWLWPYLKESPAFTAAESSPTYGCCGFCFSKAAPLSLPKYHSWCEDVGTLAVFLRTFEKLLDWLLRWWLIQKTLETVQWGLGFPPIHLTARIIFLCCMEFQGILTTILWGGYSITPIL